MEKISAIITDLIHGIYCIFACFACRSIQLIFSLLMFCFILIFTSLINPPYSGYLAIIITIFLQKYKLFFRFEKWLVRDVQSRAILLIANIAAGIFLGRVLGVIFHEIVSSTSSLMIFEAIGAVTLATTNTIDYLKRYKMKFNDCFSNSFVIH